MGIKISPRSTLAFDTAPLIYLIEQHSEYVELVRSFFQTAKRENCTLITSLITYIEVLTLPEKLGHSRLAAKYRSFLTNSEHLSIFPLNIQVADRTIYFRSHYGFKTPDAIQLAVAETAGADIFLTNDTQLKQCKEIPVYTLNDL